MKLTKLITRIAMSLIPYDIVFYKDENNRIYRLMKTPHIGYSEMDFLDMAVNKAKYAPEIVEGDIVDENDKEIRIRSDRKDNEIDNGIYVFMKNAEDFKFWDVTDYIHGKKDIDILNLNSNMKKGSDFKL